MRVHRFRFHGDLPLRHRGICKLTASVFIVCFASESPSFKLCVLCVLCVSVATPFYYPLAPLSPGKGMCYNRPAVERAAKTPSGAVAHPDGEPARSHRQDFPPKQQLAPSQGELVRAGELSARAQAPLAGEHEDASWYCPVCSQRLESRRCKLVCPVCGYYMSCADYY
jgi:hypothetical protein